MTSTPKKAMVFAAGLGTRMAPITHKIPKPLVKIAGKTLLDWSLDNLKEAGIKEVVVNTHYMADKITTHLKDRKSPSVYISHEEKLLETGGGILKILGKFDNQPFFSLNSDVILLEAKSSLKQLISKWDDGKMDALLLLKEKEKAVGYEGTGDFSLSDEGQLVKMPGKEKYVFTGVQILHPRIFKNAPDGAFSLNIFYKRAIQPDGKLSRIYGIVHKGDWLHIGTPEGIKLAEDHISMNS